MAPKDDSPEADGISVDDLVILDRDSQFYRFRKEEFKDEQKMPTSMTHQVELLVEQGVVLADIPLGSIPGVGAMCFLVNLSGLRRTEPEETAQGPSKAQTTPTSEEEGPDPECLIHPAPAIDDLVVRDRVHDKFYWIRRCEYQNPRHKVVEPVFAGELEKKLTARGVVLADVPAGRVVDDEPTFYLVNLKAVLRPELKAKEEEAERRKKELEGKAKGP